MLTLRVFMRSDSQVWYPASLAFLMSPGAAAVSIAFFHTPAAEEITKNPPSHPVLRSTSLDAPLLQLFNELKLLNLQFFLLKA